MTCPGGEEKALGKHPTQKPIALVERSDFDSRDLPFRLCRELC